MACIIKNITIVNDTSRFVRMTPQFAASLTIVILTILEVPFMLLELSFMLLENIYLEGITHDDHHMIDNQNIVIVQATGHTHHLPSKIGILLSHWSHWVIGILLSY